MHAFATTTLSGIAERHHRNARAGRYCNFCGTPEWVGVTVEGHFICIECAIDENFCETCGSTRAYVSQPPDEQLHFEEECFK